MESSSRSSLVLLSFVRRCVSEVRPQCCVSLQSAPSRRYVVFHGVNICCDLFIHSTFDGHLGSFHFGTIIDGVKIACFFFNIYIYIF